MLKILSIYMCRIINYVTSKLTKQHFIFAMLKSQKNEFC